MPIKKKKEIDVKIRWKKNKAGEWIGRYKKYKIELRKRPHGKWNYSYWYKGNITGGEGYFGTFLKTFPFAKSHAKCAIIKHIKKHKTDEPK